MLFWGRGAWKGGGWLEEASRALARGQGPRDSGLRQEGGEVLRPVWDTV